MLSQEIVNTVVQLGVVLLLSFIFWLAIGRRKAPFFRWLGLTLPSARGMAIAFALFVMFNLVTLPAYLFTDLGELATSDRTVAAQIAERGLVPEVIIMIALLAGLKTALSEEIFFRGLIGKRLIGAMGFWAGNTAQAVFFGGIHLALFAALAPELLTPVLGTAIFVLPGAAGWIMGFANEKTGNGSIFHGWLIHALGNAASLTLFAHGG